MTQIASSTPSYDADGNVTNDFLNTYTWSSFGRPVTINGVGITYDALDRMIEQNRSGSYTQIQYAPTGLKLQLITGGINGAYVGFVPLPGGAEAVWAGGPPRYRHPDWLGSSRLSTTQARGVYGDVAYAPFGEQYAASGSNDPMFTGMDEDTSANVFDFPAREYGIQGRWPSPDPAGLDAVDPSNPQTWDRYAYVLNDPVDVVDPSGMEPCPPDTATSVCVSAGDGGSSSTSPGSSGDGDGYVGPIYCGGDPRCGKSGPETCVKRQLAAGRSPAGCSGGASSPQTPGSKQSFNACMAQNASTFSIGGVADKALGTNIMGNSVGRFLEDQSAGMVMSYEGGKLGGILLGKLAGAIGGMLGKGAGELAGETAGQGGAKVLLSGGSKQAAKDIVEGLADGAQKASAKRAIAAATRSEAVSISESADGTLTVTRTRAGFDGSQTFTKTIDSAGNSSTVQTAHDAAGNLVHYDPKN